MGFRRRAVSFLGSCFFRVATRSPSGALPAGLGLGRGQGGIPSGTENAVIKIDTILMLLKKKQNAKNTPQNKKTKLPSPTTIYKKGRH